jgi:molybdate transport system substrate-binding protein
VNRLRPFLCACCCALAFAAAARAADVAVFAAASLSDALTELAARHHAATGDTVRLNLAASSTLARQIKEGARADLFFSADEAKMDSLAQAGLIDPATRASLLGNTLVVVVAADSDLAFASLRELAQARVRRLALGQTETVPAGIYAKEALQQAGAWDQVAAKVVAMENVRAALAAVENGDAEAAIVYRTDARISEKVKVAYAVPAADGPRITYPAALVRSGKNPEGARRFLALLRSDAGREVFARFGFTVLP